MDASVECRFKKLYLCGVTPFRRKRRSRPSSKRILFFKSWNYCWVGVRDLVEFEKRTFVFFFLRFCAGKEDPEPAVKWYRKKVGGKHKVK
jgi:hypothetical protein